MKAPKCTGPRGWIFGHKWKWWGFKYPSNECLRCAMPKEGWKT